MGKRMIRKQAKELSIEIWEWLYKHPSKDKGDMPERIWKQINHWQGILGVREEDCPLCFLYVGNCHKCILAKKNAKCLTHESYWDKWFDSKKPKERKEYAGLVLEIIRNWKI